MKDFEFSFPTRVIFGRDAEGRAGELAASAPEVHIHFEEGSFALGGLIAQSLELGLYLDSTFDTALAELNGHFAELFGLSLSDELEEE